jgi:D-galactarolactone cycloisomerase
LREGKRNLAGQFLVEKGPTLSPLGGSVSRPRACAGGFSGWLDILALAKSYGVATIPHVWGSGIAVAAALHAVATIPPFPHTANPLPLLNEPVIEFDRKHNPLRDELLAEPFTLKEGRLVVPDRPGLGVTVSDDTLRAYKR